MRLACALPRLAVTTVPLHRPRASSEIRHGEIGSRKSDKLHGVEAVVGRDWIMGDHIGVGADLKCCVDRDWMAVEHACVTENIGRRGINPIDAV